MVPTALGVGHDDGVRRRTTDRHATLRQQRKDVEPGGAAMQDQDRRRGESTASLGGIVRRHIDTSSRRWEATIRSSRRRGDNGDSRERKHTVPGPLDARERPCSGPEVRRGKRTAGMFEGTPAGFGTGHLAIGVQLPVAIAECPMPNRRVSQRSAMRKPPSIPLKRKERVRGYDPRTRSGAHRASAGQCLLVRNRYEHSLCHRCGDYGLRNGFQFASLIDDYGYTIGTTRERVRWRLLEATGRHIDVHHH